MKKKLLLSSTLLSAIFAQAQESPLLDSSIVKNKRGFELLDSSIVKNKRGFEILPKKGDICLGFNTIPILDMFLGTLNRATAFAGSGNLVQYTQNSNNQICGKYYLDSKTALRVRFVINTLSGSMTNQVQDASAMYKATLGTQDDINAASLLKVDDKLTFTKNNWTLSFGIEKRRGYRRLQGFYGAELGIVNTGSNQSVTYGNAFSDQYPVQFTTNFNTFAVASQNPVGAGRTVRNLTTANNGGFRIGARGFLGLEYFIFAKISLGVEYGWAYSITTRRGATSTQEVYNNGQNGPQVIIEKVDSDSSERLKGFSVDNNNGSIFSMNNTLGGNTALSGGAGALTLIFHF